MIQVPYAKPFSIWNLNVNNKTMKILLIFKSFRCIWFIDSENLCFIHILKKKIDILILFISLTLK